MDDGHHDDDGVWSDATQQNPTTKKTNAADAGAARRRLFLSAVDAWRKSVKV